MIRINIGSPQTVQLAMPRKTAFSESYSNPEVNIKTFPDSVDLKNLNDRLKANSIQEKLTNMWLDRVLREKLS